MLMFQDARGGGALSAPISSLLLMPVYFGTPEVPAMLTSMQDQEQQRGLHVVTQLANMFGVDVLQGGNQHSPTSAGGAGVQQIGWQACRPSSWHLHRWLYLLVHLTSVHRYILISAFS